MPAIDRDRWEVLEPLLDRVLSLPTEQQAAWLDELTVSSPDLAADVEALLSQESSADRRGFLSQAPDVTLAGLTLGAYALERPIGQGGMGSVWSARRVDGRFEGRVAIKLLNLALLSATGQERFRREGSLLARLTHPGIARLLDAGVSRNGQPYLVLEHVDGQPIDAFIRAQNLDVDGRIRLFLQVLAAVGHAHANLVVHRDLKPTNILVTNDGTVKLLDFGIATLVDDRGAASRTTLTVDGGRALTPEFAAPEQVRGEMITTATDVYALGTLLYLLVGGVHPTVHGCRSPGDAVRRLLEVQPARLGLGDLDTVLAKALKKSQCDRYQTVAAFADDLARHLRHEPVSARADSLAYRTRKFLRRNRVTAAAVALVMAALAGATTFSIGQMREAQRQRDVALEAHKRGEAETEFQSALMSQIGDRPIRMREILDRSQTILDRQYVGDPRFLAGLLHQLSKRYADLGDSKRSDSVLARADSIAFTIHDTRERADMRCSIAANALAENRFDDARRALTIAGQILFVVPLTTPVGSVTRVDSLIVTDTFGVRSLVRPIGDPALDPAHFSLWQPSTRRYAGDPIGAPLANRFFLAPTLARSVDGAVLEDVLLLRDEMANVAWGVEREIENAVESTVSLTSVAPASDGLASTGESGGNPLPQYRLASTVPDNWIPLLPVQIHPNDDGPVLSRLKRGAVLQADGTNRTHHARSEALTSLNNALLFDEEVPREGAHITRRRRMVRWIDGSTWVWTAFRNEIGSGEGSAGLRFDQLQPADSPGGA